VEDPTDQPKKPDRQNKTAIKINFVDYETSFQVSINGRDTLKFMGEGGEQIYYRVRK